MLGKSVTQKDNFNFRVTDFHLLIIVVAIIVVVIIVVVIICYCYSFMQMLNCCIQHKISHAQRRRTPSSSPARTSRSSVEPDQFHSPSSSLSYSQRVAGQEETMITTETRKDEDSKNDFHSCSSSDDEFFEAFETPKSETSLQKSIKELSLDSTLKMDSPSVRPKSADLKPVAVDPLSLTTDDDYTIPSSTTTSGTVAVTTDVASTTIAGDTCTNEETEGGSNTPYTRVGALEQYKDLILLRTGEPLYVPETQVSDYCLCDQFCYNNCLPDHVLLNVHRL